MSVRSSNAVFSASAVQTATIARTIQHHSHVERWSRIPAPQTAKVATA